MNSKLLIGLIILIIIIFTAFIIIKHNTMKPIIKNPKELELTYEINAGIPFKWEYVIEDESIVEFVKSYVVRDDNKGGKVGASVYTNYVFKGLKEGETTISFRTVSITGEYPPSDKTVHHVKVDKDLNISLIKE